MDNVLLIEWECCKRMTAELSLYFIHITASPSFYFCNNFLWCNTCIMFDCLTQWQSHLTHYGLPDTIWHQKSGSILAQAMACCLIPEPMLTNQQCDLVVFIWRQIAYDIFLEKSLKITTLNLQLHFSSIQNSSLDTCCEISLRWLPLSPVNEKSTFVQVMVWCRQATNIYLSQY